MSRPGRAQVLSIDGGGIRGIVPALVLAELERLTERRVAELFDLIAGTSTGGILALGLTMEGPGNRPQYRAEELAALYEGEGRHIFSRSRWHQVTALGNLIEEKYPSAGLDEVLARYYGKAMLSEALADVLVPAYEIELRAPFFFRSSRARGSPDYDFPVRVAAHATSAAPTYFEPVQAYPEGEGGPYALIDGGVYANNPAMCAFVEAITSYPEVSEILVVSLGTGEATRPIAYDAARGWGLAEWAKPMLGVVFDGVSDTVSYQLEQLCNRGDGPRRYWRFQPELPQGYGDIDDASPGNLSILRTLAAELIRQRRADLEEVAARLVEE